MDLAAFENSPVGLLIPISGVDPATGKHFEHRAFLPSPLPRKPELEQSTWNRVVSSSAALAKLDQAARQIPDTALARLRRPAIRREAQSTSALEGTHTEFQDLFGTQLELGGMPQTPSAPVVEVLNYVRAAEQAFEWIQDRPLTLGMLGELQLTLVRGTRGQYGDAGGIRDRQVFIGADGCSVAQSRFVPPPPGDQLRHGMEAWLDWVNSPNPELPPVVRAALAHYQFETLHPFSDGNGRIGRLLIVLQLMKDGVLRDPLLIVSPWFEARRKAYQDELTAVSQTGDLDPWIRFFCSGLQAQSILTTETIEQLLAYQEELRSLIHSVPLRGAAARIADDLIAEPIISTSSAAQRYGVSFQAANTAVAKLVEIGLLQEITGRAYGRIFASQRIISIFVR